MAGITIAVIPARGGSKRIPRKNVRPFFGHPMLAYTVAAALRSELFDRILVSTDDAEIGDIAEWYGAEYLERPPAMATDEAGMVEVNLHAIEEVEKAGARVDTLCVLMPICPLRSSQDILDHHERFQTQERDFQISVVPFHGVHPHWAIAKNEQGEGRWFWGEEHLGRSQTLEKTFCPTGAVWWMDAAAFKEKQDFYGPPFHAEPMDANRGIDIDTPEDLALADTLVRGLRDKHGESPLEPIDTDPYPTNE